jgi:5-methylcytosine-specific restriction protein A
MPSRPQPYCRGNNRQCPNKAEIKGLCKQHHDQAEREYDAKRPDAVARGYDAQWRETRRKYLAEHPYCECDQCLEAPVWKRPPATDVDHIDGLGPKGPRGHDPGNLRAMAHAHHSRRTAADQPGGWNRRPRRPGGVLKDYDDET